MPGNHRSPGADVVDIALALHIEQVGTLGSLHKHRRPMQALESTHWGVDATRNMATSLFEQCCGSGHNSLFAIAGVCWVRPVDSFLDNLGVSGEDTLIFAYYSGLSHVLRHPQAPGQGLTGIRLPGVCQGPPGKTLSAFASRSQRITTGKAGGQGRSQGTTRTMITACKPRPAPTLALCARIQHQLNLVVRYVVFRIVGRGDKYGTTTLL